MRTSHRSSLLSVCLLVCVGFFFSFGQGRPCHLHSSQLQEKGEVSGIPYPYPKREAHPFQETLVIAGNILGERHKELQAGHGTVAYLKPTTEQKQNVLIKKKLAAISPKLITT